MVPKTELKLITNILILFSLLIALTYLATPCSLVTRGWAISTDYFISYIPNRRVVKAQNYVMILSSLVITLYNCSGVMAIEPISVRSLQATLLTSKWSQSWGMDRISLFSHFICIMKSLFGLRSVLLPFSVLRWTIQ